MLLLYIKTACDAFVRFLVAVSLWDKTAHFAVRAIVQYVGLGLHTAFCLISAVSFRMSSCKGYEL